MKKTYNNPTLTVVKVQPAQLMQASPVYNTEVKTKATSGNLGRGGSFSGWNNEEEE